MSEPEVHQDAPFVFLSHTGRDSRMKGIMWLVKTVLTDELHLLQRQQVFFDQSNLDAGRSNSTQMDNAAARSTIGVAFLSPTYLERRWCVHELAVFLCKEDLLPLQDAGTQALNQLKPISPAYHKDRKLSLANVALRPSAPASAANRVLLTIFWNTRPEDVGGTESPHMSEDFQERLRQRLSSYPDSDRVVLTSGKVDDQGDMEEIEWLIRDVLPAIIVRLGRAVPPTSQLRAACRTALMLDDDKEVTTAPPSASCVANCPVHKLSLFFVLLFFFIYYLLVTTAVGCWTGLPLVNRRPLPAGSHEELWKVL